MTGEDLDEDLLMQEARQQHARIRSTSLGRTTRGRSDSHNTPIKEEDEEGDDDFDDGNSIENSKSKHSKQTAGTGSNIMIEEANNNFDSNNSSGLYDKGLGSSSKNNISKRSAVMDEADLEERSDL